MGLWHFDTPHVLGLFGLIAVAVLGWIKRKGIAALTKTSRDAFWSYVRKNVHVDSAANRNEKTYTGAFQFYNKYVERPRDWVFVLDQDGVTTQVRVWPTNIFDTIRRGELVEIDTEVIPGHQCETVKRVRAIASPRPVKNSPASRIASSHRRT